MASGVEYISSYENGSIVLSFDEHVDADDNEKQTLGLCLAILLYTVKYYFTLPPESVMAVFQSLAPLLLLLLTNCRAKIASPRLRQTVCQVP